MSKMEPDKEPAKKAVPDRGAIDARIAANVRFVNVENGPIGPDRRHHQRVVSRERVFHCREWRDARHVATRESRHCLKRQAVRGSS